MGQYFGRQTGHSDEGNPWQRDMTDEGKQLSDERHSGAQRGAPEDEGQQISVKRHKYNNCSCATHTTKHSSNKL